MIITKQFRGWLVWFCWDGKGAGASASAGSGMSTLCSGAGGVMSGTLCSGAGVDTGGVVARFKIWTIWMYALVMLEP